MALESCRIVQPDFLHCYPAAFFANVFWLSDHIGKLFEIFTDILSIPLAESFFFFSHFSFPYAGRTSSRDRLIFHQNPPHFIELSLFFLFYIRVSQFK